MTTTFEFVALDPSAKLKPGKETLIRSRCMQGKNRRPNSRRSQKEQKKKASNAIALRPGESQSLLSVPDVLNKFAFGRFAWPNIDTESRHLLFKAAAFNVSNASLTPLDRCVDFDALENVTFQWLFSDAAFLHSVLYATYAVNDFLSPQWNGQSGEKTLFHLRETLRFLNKKIAAPGTHEDEALLNIVVQLGLLAACFGDWCAAVAHFSGLHKIIELRGGQEFLRTRPKLHFKIDRLDLAYSLSSGKRPFFQRASAPWHPILTAQPLDSEQYHPPVQWDYRLQSVFLDFQQLATTINRYMQSHVRYNAKCFQDVLSSLQSRLMYLDGTLEDPAQELIRLSLLAFLATTFKTPGRAIPYGWIANQIAKTYMEIDTSFVTVDYALRLWVLMIAAISVTGVEELWLQTAWKEYLMDLGWDEVKRHLMSVMWVECIHDGPGAAVHNKLANLQYRHSHEETFSNRPDCKTPRW